MGSGVVTVGRRPYAVGLYWENSASGRVAETAKEAARQPGQQADFYAIRGGDKNGRIPQFGLGQIAAGHKTGMAALAACIANQQIGSWAGAFRLKEGTVVIIVRDDLVVPDGDQFFFNENDARDRFLQEIGFGGLQRIFAPESWAISGADTLPISLLLDDRHDIKLRSVATSRLALGLGIGFIAVVVLGLAAEWYYQKVQSENERQKLEQENALAAMRARANSLVPKMFQANQAPVYPPPERSWETHPLAMEVVESCREALKGIAPVLNGWHLGQLKCNESLVSMTWNRLKGPTAIPQFAEPAKTVMNDSGTTATITLELPPLHPRGNEDLVNPDTVIQRYLSLDWSGNFAAVADDPLPAAPPGFKGKWAPPLAPWIKRSFTVTLQDLPGSLPAMFADIPGVVISSLTYSPGEVGGSWQIVGVVYENRN